MILYQGAIDPEVNLKNYTNIISLVPSISWYLFDLNLQDSVKAITKFCYAPKDEHKHCIKIGGTKNPDIQKIISLKPDLIIANKEENRKSDIDELSKSIPVFLSDVYDMQSMFQMMKDISLLTNTLDICNQMTNCIQSKRMDLEEIAINKLIKVAYLIWKDPYMTIGKDTFINHILSIAGFDNVFSDEFRYPSTSLQDIHAKEPDFVFLSSEPYPFNIKHLAVFNPLKSVLVDGRMFSWYGSFMLQSFDYLNALKKNLITVE